MVPGANGGVVSVVAARGNTKKPDKKF